MRYSCYQWNPKRFHPEFSGIATRYSGVKKQRLTQQKKRKQLQSDHCYTLNLNQSLDKTLQSRIHQLHKLQQARQRHLNDLKFKQQLNQERRKQLQNLRQRNNQTKRQNKKNIEQARKNLIQRNQNSRIKLKQNLNSMSQRLEKHMDRKKLQKSLRYKLVKQEEQFGQNKINSYHKEKNQQSVQLYLQKIQQQDKKKRQEQKRIKKYQRQLKHMNKTVATKKDCLNQVQAQIYKLRTNLKAMTSVNKLKRKMVKMTEGSDDEISSQVKKHAKATINPQEDIQIL